MTAKHEVLGLPGDAIALIRGQDLKQLLDLAEMLASGVAPKGEVCLHWSKNIQGIIERAEVGIL